MANKAIIELAGRGEIFDYAMKVAHRVDAGLPVEEADYHLSFETAAQLFAELTPARLALLELLKREGPLSIYALAQRAGRNYSNVHRDVQKLLEHELVAKDDQGRIYVPWDEVLIRVRLGTRAA